MLPQDRTLEIEDQISLPDLRVAFNGNERIFTPGDAGYDEGRTVVAGGIDRWPAVVTRPVNALEVARVVQFARESGLELAVRSGGHSMAGHSVSDGGIVLDLSDMQALDINVDRRTAWVQTGLTTGKYTVAAAAHGLATSFGDTGSVGIGGITLGGGVGFLARKYGLTIDHLLAAELVTAGGEILFVDEESYPDLFWAIRGGGGNFGVATRFQFRLHPVQSIVGGALVLPATPGIIAAFVAAANAAPDELTTIANVMPAPPLPFIPEEQHGRLILFALLCYAGDPAAGEKAIAPFRALATPIADMVQAMRYVDLFRPGQEGADDHLALPHTLFTDEIGRAEAETIVDYLQASDAPFRAAQLRVLGGAVSRVPIDATAYAHRQRRILVNLVASYSQPEERALREEWIAQFAAALRQGEPAAYVNFLGDEGPARVRQAYPGAHWERLLSVKRRYDPDNLFRLNQNVAPSPPV